MSIFMSDKRSLTGGRSPKPAVCLTCASYEETLRLARECKKAGIEVTWTLPDLEREQDWAHNTRLLIQGKCRVDRMEPLRELAVRLYERDGAIIEIPDAHFRALLFILRQEVWGLCQELSGKELEAAARWLDSKRKWVAGQAALCEYDIVSSLDYLGPGADEESISDLKNLGIKIENLDQSHCKRVKLGRFRSKRVEMDPEMD